MQQEEEAKAQQQSGNKNSHHVTKWKQDTQSGGDSGGRSPQTEDSAGDAAALGDGEYLDVDVDSCTSEDET